MNQKELYALLDKYLADKATQEEIDSLTRYYNSFQQNDQWNASELGSKEAAEARMFERIKTRIKLNEWKETGVNEKDNEAGRASVVRITDGRKLFRFRRITAAACVILLLAVGAFVWFKHPAEKTVARTKSGNKLYKNDVSPGGNKAVLTLADGSTINLNDTPNGTLAQQGDVKVIKANGSVHYNASSAADNFLYNTVSTPKGGKYRVELADGTVVWLNAASSLYFPTAFSGRERRVEITGEAYFEVAQNKALPFIVGVNGAEVRVLGTHFNIMAYREESSLKTTLLEGSVKFVTGESANILEPGQQLQLLESGQARVEKAVDLEEVMAWKNGIFHFGGTDIGTVMRQLARWYDVDVIYSPKIDDRFYAEIPRNTKLSDVLTALQLTGKVHFEIDGRKIIATE